MLNEALILIGASVLLVPVLQRLGLGSVLGYLIAGVLVGPQGFHLVNSPEEISHLAEFGVILLLFLIGLEIQPRKLWSMRKMLFGLGGAQIAMTTFVFALIALGFGLSCLQAAVVGFALSLSSTAVALQSLTEKNEMGTEHGRATFSILLMQDMAAIPGLALIPVLAASKGGDSFHPTFQSGLFIAGFLLLLLGVSRYLMTPFFRFLASTRSTEIFTSATLLIVLGVAAIMQYAGFSASLGTFIAGMLLADSEYRHELESDIQPFKGLLMGLFFIAIGMGVNLELILTRPAVVFGFVALYLIAKISITFVVARLFRIGRDSSLLAALLLAQGGEFSFVIFRISGALSMISDDTLALLTVVITASMILTPALILSYQWWVRLQNAERLKPEYDQIAGEEPTVIIAGFGRFGQVFGRILRSQGIQFVAIDHDPDQIELLRKFGNKVYYGDASRKEILEAAGAAKAKYFVLAIDDVEESNEAALRVTEAFPHLKIFARARNRGHAYDLMAMKIPFIKREIFDSSVEFTGELLTEMGYARPAAEAIVRHFKQHDQIMLEKQFAVRDDDKSLISISKQANAQLAEVLRQDQTQSYVSR